MRELVCGSANFPSFTVVSVSWEDDTEKQKETKPSPIPKVWFTYYRKTDVATQGLNSMVKTLSRLTISKDILYRNGHNMINCM